MNFKKAQIRESFNTHSQLNKKLFDGEVLLPEIRDRLLLIANDFISGLEEEGIPLKVYDIWLVGSNAAYNYGPDSDIDVHVIVDCSDIDVDKSILTILYDYAKAAYNKKYDIKVKGHEVELYLEDMNTTVISNGIYSITKDEWIKKPTPLEDNVIDVEKLPEYREWMERYCDVQDEEDIEQFIDDLYLARKEGLANEGEMSPSNLVFKELRNDGTLDTLKGRLDGLKSKELSLEKLANT